ncbi:MAG TPA: TonB-dependent receptor [Acidobacteriaceae bacterium]|nr:TonB-dependent receptor [Acidobacteriaceae bacterium]
MNVRIQAIAALFALSVGAAFGQATNSADLTGTVTDSSGAVVPGVTVTVLDMDKNLERTYTTNDSGLYDTGPIVPEDRYMITFTKSGFATLQRGPMTLHIGVIGLNAQMGVAQSTQQVVVNEAAPLLETTTAEISTTLPADTLQQLPQVGPPDWQQFIVLMPGTSGTPQNGNNTVNPGMGGVAANGSLPFSTALLDGAMTSSPMSNNVIMVPIFDAIGEVKISDSLFSAQYGIGGLLYNQISKGGSNEFHGMGYDYFRNSAMNAASYAFGTGVVSPLHYNDFGGNIGGPVIKNRVFFFFAYDRAINHSAPTSATIITVPTDAVKAGDFTGMPTVYDPTTQKVDPVTGIVTRRSFADEYGNGNRIPSTLIDPVAKAIQALYPEPNRPATVLNGLSTANYSYLYPSSTPVVKYFGRFDADVTKNNRLTGSAEWNNQNAIGLSPVCPVNCTPVSLFSTNNQISDVWTISPKAINEARAGFMGEYDLLVPETLGAGYPTKLGMKFAKADLFPTINITNWYALAPGTHSNYKENLFDFSDVVTLIRGRHVLHIGGEFIVERADSTAWGNINAGTLGFTGVYTAGSNDRTSPLTSSTGSAYADFLLGYSKSWSAGSTPEYGGRLKSPAAFVQDDLKLTPKLTLNLGLRWYGTTGWSEVHGNQRGFDQTIINPATNAPGGMWYALTHVNGRKALQASQFNDWLPRVGAAYQLGTNMTVRGGFGMYTFPWNTDTYGNGQGAAFGTSGNETDSTNNVAPVVILSSDGNTNYQGSKGASINALYLNAPTGAGSYNGQQVSFSQYHQPVPMLKQWNLTVQRQMNSNTMVEVAYVGSRGTNLAVVTDLNQVPVGLLGPNDASARPYPEFQSITGINAVGISNYNALQASVERRMSNSLEFNFNYTWSHMLDYQDSSGWGTKQGTQPFQNAYSPAANYGPSNFDIRNMFKGQSIYLLPFGSKQRFLNSSAILDQFVGGWMLSGTFVAQGGNPFTPNMAINNSYSQSSNALQYPNVVGNPKLSSHGVNEWFNVAAYGAPAAGTFGDMRRNSVYGPGLTQLNLGLRKTFPIRERISADFSVNATNALNHASFGQPDPLIGPGHIGKITTVTVGGRAMELVGKIRF